MSNLIGKSNMLDQKMGYLAEKTSFCSSEDVAHFWMVENWLSFLLFWRPEFSRNFNSFWNDEGDTWANTPLCNPQHAREDVWHTTNLTYTRLKFNKRWCFFKFSLTNYNKCTSLFCFNNLFDSHLSISWSRIFAAFFKVADK